MSTLLLGMGNPILCDDGVGVRLAKDFSRRLGSRPGLTVEPDCSAGGLNILDVFTGHSRAIVLDSLRTTGGVPGHWCSFDATALAGTMHLRNIHDANFATVLQLGHRLGLPLPAPEDIHIFAVEVQDAATFSERMTPALEEAYPVFSGEIFREVERLLAA